MAVKVIPRNGLVTLRKIKEEGERKVGSIIIPGGGGEVTYKTYLVEEVGPGIWDAGKQCATEDLKKGDKVLVKDGMRQGLQASLSIFKMDFGDGDIFIVNQSDIVAIVRDDQPALKLTEGANS